LRLELLIAISVRCLITISIRYLVALDTCFLLSLFLVIVELEFVLNGLVSLEAFVYAYYFLGSQNLLISVTKRQRYNGSSTLVSEGNILKANDVRLDNLL
jgi:hypothetical protein